jgi:hypothetical protein
MTRRERAVWAPRRSWWWLAVLFGAGSVCFLVAPFPAFLAWVGPQADAAVFFGGSLLFTAAATVQFATTVRTLRDSGGRPGPVVWQPHSADWWSSGVQLAGTVAFNVTTFGALVVAIDSPSYDRLVWRPDAVGSVCFLVSGLVAYAAVAGGVLRRPPRSLDGGIVAVDLAGCLAFGVAALASYVLPASGQELAAAVANTGTSLGALAFLVGAFLLLPQGVRQQDTVSGRT